MKNRILALIALPAIVAMSLMFAGSASATGNYGDHDWLYNVSCTGVSGDRPNTDSVDSNIRIKNLDTNAVQTFNYHGPDSAPAGPFTYTLSNYGVPASWTHYEIQWVQVNGTNYHWEGSLPCGGDTPPPSSENKKVTLCHYDGSNENGGSGKYSKITISVMAFYNAGHIDHVNDIWEAFSYTDKSGTVHNVPAQGDTSLLAFDDCVKPHVDEKVTKPTDVYQDKCGTEDDVFAVAPGRGYTVGAVQTAGGSQSITATLDEGFAWTDGTKTPITFTHPAFTNVDCGLPDTGTNEQRAVIGGVASIIALVGGALMFMTAGRRKSVI